MAGARPGQIISLSPLRPSRPPQRLWMLRLPCRGSAAAGGADRPAAARLPGDRGDGTVARNPLRRHPGPLFLLLPYSKFVHRIYCSLAQVAALGQGARSGCRRAVATRAACAGGLENLRARLEHRARKQGLDEYRDRIWENGPMLTPEQRREKIWDVVRVSSGNFLGNCTTSSSTPISWSTSPRPSSRPATAFTSLMLVPRHLRRGIPNAAAGRLDPRLIHHRPHGPAHRADPHARADAGDRNVHHRAHARLRNHRAARAAHRAGRGA